MHVELRSESRRLNFHGQPGRQVRLRVARSRFLFEMTKHDLFFMHEPKVDDAEKRTTGGLTGLNRHVSTIALARVALRQGDSIRLGRSPEFIREGLPYCISIEDTEGKLDQPRTDQLADRNLQFTLGNDIALSKHHATIDVMTKDIVMVNDLGSTNGTHLIYLGL